jgi:hypothetical protein
MTAAIATALRETADRSAIAANIADLHEASARKRLDAAALKLAEAVLRAERTDALVAAYAEARAEWIARVEVGANAILRASECIRTAQTAETELAHASPFVADEKAWRNERALQEAATEKEANK